MKDVIVSSVDPIGLAGGGPADSAALELARKHVGGWVAADGGADLLLGAGLVPHAVIGDMDSLSDAARAAFADVMYPIAEQDSTDFDKALRNSEAPAIVAVGFMGGRIDHQLAALNTLVRRADRHVVLLGQGSAVMHMSGPVELDLPEGTPVSLFPLRKVRVDSHGLRWPTEGIEFAPDGRVGTSNESLGGAIRLAPSGPGMLLIVPDQACAKLLPG